MRDFEEIRKVLINKGITGYQLQRDLDISQVGADKIISGETKSPRKTTLRMLSHYIDNDFKPLDYEEKNKTSKVSQTPSISDKGVPYYDVDFYGGFDSVFNDQTIRPNFYIDFPPYNGCDAWINVTGKSMSPFISHGDIAALKKLDNWKNFIPFGEVYAIYTTEHRTIKIVTAGKDEDHLTLIPYNKGREFVEQQIPKKLIKQMFRVYGSIKKFF